MEEQRIDLLVMELGVIRLGKAGEGNRKKKRFMTAAWRQAHPDAQISLHVTPPNGVPYLAALDEDEDGNVIWTITDADTAWPGSGKIELILSDPTTDTTIKSVTGRTVVDESPSQQEPGEPPEPHVPWWEKVLQLVASGGSGGSGGVSPTITVATIAGGHRLTITDVLGTKTVDVMDGEDGAPGAQGKAGENGVSPTVSVEAITGGHRVTITDVDGAKTFDVMDGQDGSGGGSGAAIDDETPSATTTYSSSKIDELLNEQKEAIDAKGDPTDEQVSAAVNTYLDENPVSGGISTTAKNLLITILRSGVYTDDQSVNITALETALGGGTTEPEEPDVPVEKTYTISNELINCISSNSTTRVKENASYSATLTANDGYTLTGGTVTVTIGGVDITETTYADGVVTIASVTGNVEIFASAVAVQAEAALPKDGLLAYFDFRTTVYNNAAGTGLTTIEPTLGSGQLFTWAKDSISQQNEYGLVPANTRSWQYSQNGGTTHTALGTAFTVVSLTYGEVPKFGFNYSNAGAQWLFAPKYVDSAGSTVAAETVNGSSFNSDAKTDYNFTTVRADGTTLTEIMDTSRTEFDGSSIDAFDRWLDKVEGNTATGTNGQSYVAMAIYNRALTDVEIESARGFMKTLEVTA